MKSITFIVLLCCLWAALADDCGGGGGGGGGASGGDDKCPRGYIPGHNGRPTCNDASEVEKKFRNNFDPTRYWQCGAKGSAAVSVNCPINQGFKAADGNNGGGECISWTKWVWTPECDPPTKA